MGGPGTEPRAGILSRLLARAWGSGEMGGSGPQADDEPE